MYLPRKARSKGGQWGLEATFNFEVDELRMADMYYTVSEKLDTLTFAYHMEQLSDNVVVFRNE